jgi:hypothetical protein
MSKRWFSAALASTFMMFAPVDASAVRAGNAAIEKLMSFDVDHCFERQYSRQHLASHPKQVVSYIAIKRFPENWNTRSDHKGKPLTYIQIDVKFAGSSRLMSEGAICTLENGKLECGIECDGGGFSISGRGKAGLRLRTGEWGFRVVANAGCDGEASENDVKYVTRKTDDKIFALREAPMARCIRPKN